MDGVGFFFVMIFYIIVALVIGSLGVNREIGMWPAFFLSLFLSPLVGAIFVATSQKRQDIEVVTPELSDMLNAAFNKKIRGDYEGALHDYFAASSFAPSAPTIQIKIASVYSLMRKKTEAFEYISKAIEQGYNRFDLIQKNNDFDFLRNQPEYLDFVSNRYRLPKTKDQPKDQPDDVVGQIERLGKLKDQGYLTNEEFQAQKKKILDL